MQVGRRIESGQNRTIKDIRRLKRSKGDLALLEGPHLVGEAIALGLALDPVLATAEFLASPEGRGLNFPLEVLEVDTDLLASLSDADAPKGLLAVASLPRGGVEALPRKPGGTWLYLDHVQDPGNLGAIARVAEAFGAAGLALSEGCCHPNHPRALRASAGSLLRIPTAIGVEANALAQHLAAVSPPLGARWVALAAPHVAGSTRLGDADLAGSLVFALGAEGAGLSPELFARADLRITIPLAPPVESLNVATAAAIVLWERCRS